ncbi:MAG: hypothetical protein II879_12175 [Clostridia bacterium]|nr:hypothetical protein [Clostridia bacterium]
MLTAAAIALGILALTLEALGAWKRSSRLSWLGGLCFIAFMACMLLLDRPWEQMQLPALVLLGVSGWRARREAP